MNFNFLPWLTFGSLLGALLGFAVGKGDPQAPLFVGTVGACLGLAGCFVVSAVHKTLKIEASTTDHGAIAGGLVGSSCGAVIGAFSGFGKVMISIFNPDLPVRDWGVFFGATGGVILGALFGACVASAVLPLLRSDRRLGQECDANEDDEPNIT